MQKSLLKLFKLLAYKFISLKVAPHFLVRPLLELRTFLSNCPFPSPDHATEPRSRLVASFLPSFPLQLKVYYFLSLATSDSRASQFADHQRPSDPTRHRQDPSQLGSFLISIRALCQLVIDTRCSLKRRLGSMPQGSTLVR